MSSYRITVDKNALTFAAGHFITYSDHGLEPVHGHNYRVSAQLIGELDEHSLVYDFVALRGDMEQLLSELDHRFLHSEANPRLDTQVGETEVEIRHGDRRYVFPRGDVVLLPIPNTTAERLAGLLADRLAGRLDERGVRNIDSITVEVEEAPGQSASFTRGPVR